MHTHIYISYHIVPSTQQPLTKKLQEICSRCNLCVFSCSHRQSFDRVPRKIARQCKWVSAAVQMVMVITTPNPEPLPGAGVRTDRSHTHTRVHIPHILLSRKPFPLKYRCVCVTASNVCILIYTKEENRRLTS